jgi:hypothetical protein
MTLLDEDSDTDIVTSNNPGNNNANESVSAADEQSTQNIPDLENPRPLPDIVRPSQRRRLLDDEGDLPIDHTLIGKYVLNTREISIQELLHEDVELDINLSRTHLVVQILRIITPQTGNTGNAYTRYQRGNQQQKLNFIRILLCRNGGRLCYLMMTNEMNKRIFHRDLMLRDNGTITIGSYMRILAPYPIERNMKGIPLVKTHYPAIAMMVPIDLHSISINTYIQANQSSVALLKYCDVEVRRTTPIQTTCSGKHCDKQRPLDWCNNVNRGCGCWGTSTLGTSNIALMHNIVLNDNFNNRIRMNNFSSTKFNRLFMDKVIPPNTTVASLEQTEETGILEEAIENCLSLINDNGGFEVLLWYSRGAINDQSLVGLNVQEEEGQVDSGKIVYHVVEIKPMNRNFWHENTALGSSLKNMQFKVGSNL